MKWWLNVGVQWTLAHLPYGDRMALQLQKRFGGLKAIEESSRFERCGYMLDLAAEWSGTLRNQHVVELGTGWVPVLPLAFAAAGARVDTYDVANLVEPEIYERTVRETGRRLEEYAVAAREPAGEMTLRFRAMERAATLADALAVTGGNYVAPVDTRRLPYEDGAVDLVVTSLVFQSVPIAVMDEVLRESHRILKPGGYAIHRMRMTDEYAAEDPGRSHFEYLKYSHAVWERWFNHSLKHCNRLRASHFLKAFADAGFDVVWEARAVERDSVPYVASMPLPPLFAQCTPEDLATTNLDVVLQKPSTVTSERTKPHTKPQPQGAIP